MRVASVVLVGRGAGADLTHTVEARAAEEETESLRRIAARHGARLERLADGSVLAVVEGGLPSDQAAQAARCALALRRALPHRPAALATGRASLGRRVPIGEPIDTAAALLGGAVGRGVRIDQATASLLGDVFVVDGDVLFGEADSMALRSLATPPSSPLVGRERPLAQLEALFEECRDETVARAAVVVAQAGGGKSRLLTELVRRLREDGPPAVWLGRGDPVGAGSTFGILGAAVRRGLGIDASMAPAAVRARLVERAGEANAPFVAELLGAAIDPSEPVRDDVAAARRDPKLMYDRIRAAFEALVVAETARGPVAIVLEDLQWGDEPSVRLLDAALRAAGNAPLFVLALGRPEVEQRFAGLWPETGSQRVLLEPLTRRAATMLVRGLVTAASDGIVTRIVDEGGGNPLLLEELARAERDQCPPESGPRTLAAMLHARLERVPAELRLVLRAASVFGRTFSPAGVCALLDLDPMETSKRIARLVDGDLVANAHGAEDFVFRSALTREATYASLTDPDRCLGHRLAGEWLESAGELEPLVLGEHAERAADSHRAAHFFLLAARRARAASFVGGVDALVNRSLACGAAGAERGALLLLRAEARQWRGELDAASQLLDEALADLPAGTEDWFAALALLGLGEFRRGHRDEADAIAERMLACDARAEGVGASRTLEFAAALVLFGRTELGSRLGAVARVADDAAAQAELRAFRATCAFMDGDLESALEGAEGAAELLERAGDLRAAALELLNAAHFRWELGDDEGAELLIRRGTELRARLGLSHPQSHNLARVVARRGRLDEAIALEHETIDASRRSGDARIEGFARAHLAGLHLERGDVAGAEAEARGACDLLAGAPTLRPFALATLSNVLRARGDARGALALAKEAAEAAGAGIESGEAVVALALAESLQAMGDAQAAKVTLAASVERLRARASRIRDSSLRESFLARVPENARMLSLARAWCVEPSTP